MIKIKLGLILEQAILFGALFIFFGFYGIYNSIDLMGFVNRGGILFSLLPIVLGLAPFVSRKYLIISEQENLIEVRSTILFLLNFSDQYNLKEYDTFFFGNVKRSGSVGGGFLPAAKNFHSLTEIDLCIEGCNKQKRIIIKNIGNAKKAQRVFNRLEQESSLVPKFELKV